MSPPPRIALFLLSLAAATLTGCAVTPCCAPPTPLVASPAKILATGYGSPASYSQYTAGQQKLMAMRAAQMDAYRNLAERVHGFRVTGDTSVSAFVTQSDRVRSHVDAFIRGAKVVNTAFIADGNVEVTVELDLTPQFFQCVANVAFCPVSSAAAPSFDMLAMPGCTASACVAPSAHYHSY